MPWKGPDIILKCPSIIYAGPGGVTVNVVEDEKGCRLNILEIVGKNSCAEGAEIYYVIDSDHCAEGAKNFGPPPWKKNMALLLHP